MRWRGRRQSSNIDDRRGRSPLPGGFGRGGSPIRIPAGRGGISFTGIIILVVGFFVLRALGIDPAALLDPEGQSGGRFTQEEGTQASDEMREFVAVVLADTEDVWNDVLQHEGAVYREPTLTMFTGQVRSACGFASSASGPFYCPGDNKVYLDTAFFDQLARQFGAAGDFAQAYVIAHEVGHHVQNLTGVLPRFNEMRRGMNQAEANEMSQRVELQADCFAGVWAHFTAQKGLLDAGDIEEAMNAARQIGDDTLQRRTQGYVVPESFNHGTSAQRQRWFANGLRNGRLTDCDTFNNPI
ncbi:MAG: zinc metallopeptidase [Rhizobiaceae bacterium]|nr:zinc metallopeptidase [Rhizobiaceae bacterium]